MPEPHEGSVQLDHGFSTVYDWLRRNGETALTTAIGTPFTARAGKGQRGEHSRQPVIRFFQRGAEFGRAYSCCWGRYHNCNRTRIGMYCAAVDLVVK